MLTNEGGLRKGSKAGLVHTLAVWAKPSVVPPDIVIVDGNPLLYRIPWSSHITNLARNIHFILPQASQHTAIVFDRYTPDSIKSQARRERGEFIDTTVPWDDVNIPDRETVMKNIAAKSQLIQRLSQELAQRYPQDLVIDRGGWWQEEADCNIIRYLGECLQNNPQPRHIQILADDTDIFILLLYHVSKCPQQQIPLITMRKQNKRVINITATIDKLGPAFCGQLLGIHALTGCDTTSFLPRLGKTRGVGILKQQQNTLGNIALFGDAHLEMEHILTIGWKICRRLYKKKQLPENMDEHIKRAHFQTYLWKRAIEGAPPVKGGLDKTQFGWTVTGEPRVGCL